MRKLWLQRPFSKIVLFFSISQNKLPTIAPASGSGTLFGSPSSCSLLSVRRRPDSGSILGFRVWLFFCFILALNLCRGPTRNLYKSHVLFKQIARLLHHIRFNASFQTLCFHQLRTKNRNAHFFFAPHRFLNLIILCPHSNRLC